MFDRQISISCRSFTTGKYSPWKFSLISLAESLLNKTNVAKCILHSSLGISKNASHVRITIYISP